MKELFPHLEILWFCKSESEKGLLAIKITFPMICHADLIKFSRAAASVACCGRDCREIEDVRDGRSE